MRKRWLMALAAAVAVLLAAALDSRLVVRRYDIDAETIHLPVRLALLTDFHGCNYGENAAELLAAVDAEKPDAVLLVGDIFDDDMPWAPSEALVRGLASRYPCYYVTGNHEYWSEQIEEIYEILQDAGVRRLNMSWEMLSVRGQDILLCGIPDPYAMVYEGAPDTSVQLERALAGADDAAFSLLLAHRPELVEQYAAAGFDLVVAGHAHGGQVRLPLLINGLYAPNQGLFPAWAGGQYQLDGTTLIVSRGLARESTAVPRVFNRPELVMIELR